MIDTINKYKGMNFDTMPKSFFDAFAHDFKMAINSQLPEEVRIATYSTNHYYISGFLVSTVCEKCQEGEVNKDCKYMVDGIVGECKGPKYAYFSISDVRHFKDKWFKQILIRSAKNLKDFTGGTNGFTNLENFGKNAKRIIERQMGV